MYESDSRPRRPAVPPSLYALVATVLVEREVLGGGIEPSDGWLVPCALAVGGACCLTLASALCHLRSSLLPTLILVLVSTSASLVLSSLTYGRGMRGAEALASSPLVDWSLELVADPTERNGSYRCRATARRDGEPATDVWLTLPERLRRGCVVRCVGTFSPLGDDDWARSSRLQGVWGSVRAVRIVEATPPQGPTAWLGSVRERVVRSFGATSRPSRALLAGGVCAQRDGIMAFGLDDTFSRCGISHLVAVSGGHLSVLVMMLSSVMESLRMGHRRRVAVLVASCGAFVLFCGAPVSAVRAFLMTSIALVGGVFGRRSHGLSGVAVVALAMALLDPSLAGQQGFALSVTSVCALCLFGAYANYAAVVLVPEPCGLGRAPVRMRKVARRAWRTVRSSVATSLLVLVATLPLAVGTFGEVSLVGPLANAVLSAPFSLLVAGGLLAAALWWAPFVQAIVLVPCDLVGEAIVWAATRLASLPGSSVVVEAEADRLAGAVGALAVVLLVWWPHVSRRWVGCVTVAATALVGVALLRWRLFAPARICVLDIGQGDAILVQDGAHALLVDAGPDEAVAAALARNHVLHLDAVLVTHLHDDHYGGVDELAGRISCGNVLVAEGVAEHVTGELADAVQALCAGGLREVAYGDALRVGGFLLRVVSPVGEVDGSENAHSVELLARYAQDGRELVALLTGDAERDQMAGLLERNDVGDIDFLKVGHHGSEVSVSPEQAAVLDAEVAVASAGEGNSYGHPTAACVKTLEDAGSLFLCTKDVGDVEVRPGRDGPMVSTQL